MSILALPSLPAAVGVAMPAMVRAVSVVAVTSVMASVPVVSLASLVSRVTVVGSVTAPAAIVVMYANRLGMQAEEKEISDGRNVPGRHSPELDLYLDAPSVPIAGLGRARPGEDSDRQPDEHRAGTANGSCASSPAAFFSSLVSHLCMTS